MANLFNTNKYPALALPPVQLVYTGEQSDAGRPIFFDRFRKRPIVLTPEEWVRQHIAAYLVDRLGYPASLVKFEGLNKYEQLNKRCDIVIYGRDGQAILLAECKAAHVPVDSATVSQLAVYNMHFKASILIVSNGLLTFCAQLDPINNTHKPLSTIPSWVG